MPALLLLLLAAPVAAPCAPALRPLAARWAVERRAFDCGAGVLALTDEIPPSTEGTLALPIAVGAVAVAYNLLVAGDLRLTPEVLAAIYQGRLARWNDPRIAAINPGVTLPDLRVVVVREDEASFALLDGWLAKLGGAGAKPLRSGDGGVSTLSRTDGAIGAVDAARARRASLYLASLRNRDGAFLQPTMHSVTRAAVGVRLPPDLRVPILDASGVDSYPLAHFAYAVVPAQPAQGTGLASALRWAIHEGQQLVAPLGWAPLPGLLVRIVDERIGALRD